MWDRKPIKHKQSKYFTVMLVPYSSTKVKSIKIPHYILYGVLGAVLFLLLAAFIYYGRSSYFKMKAVKLQDDLEQTWTTNQMLNDEKQRLNSELDEEKSKSSGVIQKQREDYENNLDYYEDKLKSLEEQIDDLNKTKQEIYDKIASYNLPDSVMSSLKTAKIHEAQYTIEFVSSVKMDKMAYLDGLISDIDKRLANESWEYTALSENIDIIKPYLDAYPSAWPVRGTITSEVGSRSNPFTGKGEESHSGLDIAVSKGTSVKATGGGTVTFSGYNGNYGYLVMIDHGYGFVTYYGHNSKLLVSVGDKVERGHVIAKSGSTGRSTGPHVHYEVRQNGIIKNPRNFIKES